MAASSGPSRWWAGAVGAVAIAFGLLTLFSGGRALFGGEIERTAVGAAVPFVLWFNFLAGFLYVIAGAGLAARRRWSVALSAAIAAATVLVFLAFAGHVLTGGLYEMRTVGAMTFRCLAWIAIAAVAHAIIPAPGAGPRAAP